MSKLFTRREYLDVDDTARLLSGSFNETVTSGDVIKLAMEGRIRFSVRFKFPVSVRFARITEGTPKGQWGIDYLYVGSEEEKYLTLFGERRSLEGVFDLALRGSHTRNLVSSKAWNGVLDSDIAADDLLLLDESRELVALVDVVTEGLSNVAGEEKGEFSYSFPGEAQLVIRSSAIREFEESLVKPADKTEKKLERPPGPREHETYLNIIGVMLELLKSPKTGRDSDAAIMDEMMKNYGEKPGIKQRTLQEKFPAAKRSLTAK